MNRFDQQWQKLTALARQAPVEPDAVAPYGYATRVAARAAQAGPVGISFERFAFRGLAIAAACSAIAVALNYPVLSADQTDLYSPGTTDTIIELLDIS